MSSDRYLALLLDAPMQSWGFASRFQRRTTGLHPTKSGLVGMICAAMGLAKGSDEERMWLPRLAGLNTTVVVIPRAPNVEIRRLEDFHTVGAGYDAKAQAQFIPRKASGGPCEHPTVTHRQYLLDARFGVILRGELGLLERVAAALRNPAWGIWFGRKCCLPAAPVLAGGPFDDPASAWNAIARGAGLREGLPMDAFDRIEETDASGDAIRDVPVNFGDGASSGPDKREFAVRRVAMRPGGKPAQAG